VVKKMLNGSLEIVHQVFGVCLHRDIATGVSLETIMTKISVALLESLDSVGRQLEAHLLRYDEVDVENSCLNVEVFERSCAFIWSLAAIAWQHDESQLPCRFGITQ
jgi:hypothetical protein